MLQHVSVLLFFSFWVVFHYIDIPHFVDPLISWWIISIGGGVFTSKVSMNHYAQVFAWRYACVSLGWVSRSSIVGLYCMWLFNFSINSSQKWLHHFTLLVFPFQPTSQRKYFDYQLSILFPFFLLTRGKFEVSNKVLKELERKKTA